MGGLWSGLKRVLGFRKRTRVLLLGLDGAGKSTVLNCLVGRRGPTAPTVGFEVQAVNVGKVEFIVWDVAGQEKARHFWRHYYHGTSGVVFVVDSADKERMPIACRELHNLMLEEELQGVSVLVLANKMDLPTALTKEEVFRALEMERLKASSSHIQDTVAVSGRGVDDGFKWLAEHAQPI